jgi:iron(III) transport system substrate-binding protein
MPINKRSLLKLAATGALIGATSFAGIASAVAQQTAEVNVYTGVPREQAETVLAEFAKSYGKPVKFNVLYGPTEELIAQLNLEIRSGQPKADLLWLDKPQLQALGRRNKGLFAEVQSKHFDSLLKQVKTDDYKQVIPIGLLLYVISYNRGQIPDADSPKSFADLLDKKWENKIIMANPQSSAGVHNFFWMITQHLANKPPFGWDYFKSLNALKPQYVSGHGPIRDLVVSGERAIGIQLSFYLTEPINRGEKVWWNWAAEGVPTGQISAAVIDKSKSRDVALAAADWMISPEGQAVIAKVVSLAPVNSAVDIKFPDGKKTSDLNLIPVDTTYITEHRADIIKGFQAAVGAR